MAGMIDVSNVRLFYKVDHPNFDPNREYQAIALSSFGESAWDWITFVTENGHTYAVTVKRCTCVNSGAFSRKSTTLDVVPTPPKGGDSYLQDLE